MCHYQIYLFKVKMGVYGGAGKSVVHFLSTISQVTAELTTNVILKLSATDATLLEVTCCARLHPLLHVVECCWEFLRKVRNRSNLATGKRTQQLPTLLSQQCRELWRPFPRGLGGIMTASARTWRRKLRHVYLISTFKPPKFCLVLPI